PVRRIGLELDALPSRPADDAERPRADRVVEERRAARPFECARRQHRIASAFAEERRDRRRVYLLQVEADLVVADRFDACDVVPTRPRRYSAARILDLVDRSDDVARGERRAVLPLDTLAQTIREGEAVGADTPVLARRHFRREVRHVTHLVVELEEVAVDEEVEV